MQQISINKTNTNMGQYFSITNSTSSDNNKSGDKLTTLFVSSNSEIGKLMQSIDDKEEQGYN